VEPRGDFFPRGTRSVRMVDGEPVGYISRVFVNLRVALLAAVNRWATSVKRRSLAQ
jgi:hypothetical protein